MKNFFLRKLLLTEPERVSYLEEHLAGDEGRRERRNFSAEKYSGSER